MTVLFPDIPQTVDPTETQIDFSFNHLIACVHHGQAPGELWYPHGLAIDYYNNQIYVAEGYLKEGASYNSSRVSIFSETGAFLNTFTHPCMKWPYGIAIHRDNVYVTDLREHFILRFKVEADFRLVARLGSRGSGVGQFNEPKQLAVSTNGDVFVADFCNNRIQILDSDLNHQRHLSHHSMTAPRDVKLTQDEVFILCESTPCVKVFSYTGALIRSLISSDDFEEGAIYPWFFSLDTDSNLLLSDWRDQRIKIFSKEGTLLSTLGRHGSQAGMFIYPQGIALTNNLRLVLVSSNTDYCLQIFSFI